MYTFKHEIRVRYAETDQMGVVYYGHYLTYYEVARVESLRNLNIAYKDIEKSGIMMPVLTNESKYIRPAFYDDLISMEVRIEEMPDTRITFHYTFFNENAKVIHKGKTQLAFVDVSTNKPVKVPEYITKVLQPFFNNEN